jgi:hypothetical protein
VFKFQTQREKNSKIALKQNVNIQNQITNLQNLQASNNNNKKKEKFDNFAIAKKVDSIENKIIIERKRNR